MFIIKKLLCLLIGHKWRESKREWGYDIGFWYCPRCHKLGDIIKTGETKPEINFDKYGWS